MNMGDGPSSSACAHVKTLCVLLTFMLFLSSEPSVRRNASLPSVPSTLRKQLVVCPIPDGRTLSHSIALITELFPLLVLQNKKILLAEPHPEYYHFHRFILDSWMMLKFTDKHTFQKRPPSFACGQALLQFQPP